jgi:hypothetical protein
METEVLEPETALSLIPHDAPISRPPQEILDGAIEAATALKNVISRKKKPVIFRGEQYLQYEDWQTIGGFFGCSVATGDAEPTELDGVRGFKARARIIDANGIEVSAAEAFCFKDEDNWKLKPLFQLASMAQTRAGAKALRNKFAWVAVLAGYSPTPAEEMVSEETEQASDVPPCPGCSGPMWDNRTTKTGKQPDFKCKDKGCNKAIWLPKTEGFGNEQELRDSLFGQAEKLLAGLPEDKRKDALGRLVLLSTPEMEKKIQELADNKRKKSPSLPTTDITDALREDLREVKLREIRRDAKPENIDKFLAEHFKGLTLDELGDDELQVVYEEMVVPF